MAKLFCKLRFWWKLIVKTARDPICGDVSEEPRQRWSSIPCYGNYLTFQLPFLIPNNLNSILILFLISCLMLVIVVFLKSFEPYRLSSHFQFKVAKIKQEEDQRSLVEDDSSQKVKLNSMATSERGSCWCVWLILLLLWKEEFWQIYLLMWFWQIQITILTNTFGNFDKYNMQFVGKMPSVRSTRREVVITHEICN